jgi:diguanylate cyclase (GGDEF)-like protein
MTAENTKPKILLYNSPIPFIRTAIDPINKKIDQFQFLFAGDHDQLNEIIGTNSDISIFVVCESESTAHAEEILNRAKELLPNAARAVVEGSSDLLKNDLCNQVLPRELSAEAATIKFMELHQVHKLKWQVSEIEKIAITDPTTGLPNSRYFQSSMEVLIEKNLPSKTPFGLILVDIDQFRSFNETFGYGEGDKILEGIGPRIRSLVPECINVFKLGSDEFAVLTKIENVQQAHRIGETIRQSFERVPFMGPNHRPAYVTVSVGLAVFPDHGVLYSEIMTTAKGALNQAKRRGRNQTVVSQLC